MRDLVTSNTVLVSASTNGRGGTGNSFGPMISSNGQFVVFTSEASDLVSGDTNGASDVFVRDLSTGTTTLVSVENYATAGADYSSFPYSANALISADGRWVFFESRSTNFGVPDFNVAHLRRRTFRPTDTAGGEVWRFDRETGTNELVAFSTSSVAPAINSNGNLVAFISGINVQVYDVAQQTNYTFATAYPPNARKPVFTPDGRSLLFNDDFHLYIWDSVSKQTQTISFQSPRAVAISADSRFAAFDTISELYIVDLVARTNQLIRSGLSNTRSSLALNGNGTLVVFSDDGRRLLALDRSKGDETVVAGIGEEINAPAVSTDGRFVIYARRMFGVNGSESNVLTWQLHVRDRTLGTTTLISTGSNGANGNGPISQPVLAADGRTVVFHSVASDLVPGDYNDKSDVFVLKLGGADTDGDGMDDDWEVAYFGNLLRNGSGDFDSDGQTDLQEFLAGTDPTNNGSIFRVLTVAPIGGGSKQVIWTGNPSCTYCVEYKDDLSAANWSALSSAISWNGSTAAATDSSPSGTRFYRVVRLP